MRFITAASLFAAAIAAPAPQTSDCPNPAHCGTPSDPAKYENIDISEFFIRKDDGGIRSVDFKITGEAGVPLACVWSNPTIPTKTVTCGPNNPDHNYSVALIKPTNPEANSDFDVAIYHQTGQASGKWAEGVVPVYCHAGGDGPSDQVCNAIGPVTVVITSN